ncbi:MAG: peptidoglycan-binding protein [Nitrospirae bacterium]|uniref:peptidoglycan-binding domain-containing protein n=1 Tax=Candidatus Magnetobacterium casense TaxID=1455061 RepID=UPI00138DF388|nr:peptidoglycan-binding domain-containing protein [Candidatus Magnetobacterium casensis]MBF0337474.1 peptidoglycan-binding protein [Nitrospirota bacterium]
MKILQGLLHARGYAGIVGEVDGDFGVNTEKGVKAFQRRVLILDNGIVNMETWKKLFD